MAGQTLAETQKIAAGGAGPLTDLYRKYLIDTGGATSNPMTNAQIAASGAGFWADMARQGGQVVSP